MRVAAVVVVSALVLAGCGHDPPAQLAVERAVMQAVTTSHDADPTTTTTTTSTTTTTTLPSTTSTLPAPTTTQPRPKPVLAAGSIGDVIRSHFTTNGDSAVRVANCESSLNPSAVSRGGGNFGLFQINRVHEDDFVAVTGHPWSDVLDAEQNTIYAKHLYDTQGWAPWACAWAA